MSARESELLALLTSVVQREFPNAPTPGNAPDVVPAAKQWLAKWTVTVEQPTLMTEVHVLSVLGRVCSFIAKSPIAAPSSVDEVRYCWQFLGIVLQQKSEDEEAQRALGLVALREAVEVHYAICRPTMFDIFAHLSANEMFFVDGDSLVLEAMSKPVVDWDLMQPLHVNFFVQRILQELIARGARFHVVFFESSRWIWKHVPQKLFVRDLVRDTLVNLSGRASIPFIAKNFSSWFSQEYRDHFKEYDPEFVMMTDGESAAEQTLLHVSYTTLAANTFRSVVGDEAMGSNLAAYYHAFMIDTICTHAQVVFSSRMVFKDNAVIAFVVQSSSDRFAQYLTIHDNVVELAEHMVKQVEVPAARIAIGAKKRAMLTDKSSDMFVCFRERIIAGAIAAYVTTGEHTEAEFALCKAALVAAFATSAIPAAARAQPVADAPELRAFLDELAPFLTAVLSLIGVSGSNGQEFDPIDGHLLYAVVRLLRHTAAKNVLSEETVDAIETVWSDFVGEEDSVTDAPLSDLPDLAEAPKVTAPTVEPLKHELVTSLASIFNAAPLSGATPIPDADSPSLLQLKGWIVVQPFNEHNDVINVGRVKDEAAKTDIRSQRKREKIAARYATATREDAESLGAGLFLGKHEKLTLVVDRKESEAPVAGKVSKAHAGQKKRKEPTTQEKIILDNAQKKLRENCSNSCKKIIDLLSRSDKMNENDRPAARDQEFLNLQRAVDKVSFDDRVLMDEEVIIDAGFSKVAVWRALVAAGKVTEREAAIDLKCLDSIAAFVEQDHKRFIDKQEGVLLSCVYNSAANDWKGVGVRFVQQICLPFLEAHCVAALEHRMMKLAYFDWVAERNSAREGSRKPDLKKAVTLFIRIHVVLTRLDITKIRLLVEDVSLIRGAVRHLEFDDKYNEKIDGMIASFQELGKLGSLPETFKPRYKLLADASHTVARFQMCEMGELLERPVPPFRDPRVGFKPDEWQRELLDIVDSRRSAIVCAPTSAGKTFISFYCMKHTLMTSNDRIVVYVAPTRALINQATADVCARFGTKVYSSSNAGMHVCGNLGGDDFHYYHDSCQVLITLPDVFETMLMSPKYAEWSKRIDYVIFDEIHSMESSGNGPVWERIISLTTAPFVALSATLGETEQFCEWLNRIQQRVAASGEESRDYTATVIPRPGKRIERWNDIEKYVYQPPQGCNIPFSSMERDFEFEHVKCLHPLSTVTLTMLRGKFPPDLTLVPKECVKLYDVMKEALAPFRENYDGIDAFNDMVAKLHALEPDRFFTADRHIVQNRAREYERTIKAELLRWAKLGVETLGFTLESMTPEEVVMFHEDMTSIVTEILNKFQQHLMDGEEALKTHSLFIKNAAEAPFPDSIAFVKKNILNVLRELKQCNRRPTIVFSFESEDCETLVEHVVSTLEEAEAAYRRTTEFEMYVKSVEQKKQALETARRVANANQGNSERGEDGENGPRQKEKENIKEDVHDENIEDIPDVLPQFTFFRNAGMAPDMLKKILEDCEERGAELFARAIKRGICMHHVGVSGKLRGHAERMFRSLACTVIFATETLALGVHSPCRSVVLAGDHILLNTTQFRQMMGRAGRRGLDHLGHLVMMGISLKKVNRLMTSDLMVIKGHVQVDGITQLRLLQLHDYEKHAEITKKDYSIWKSHVQKLASRIFTNPLFFLGRERMGGNMEGFQIRLLQAMLRYFYTNGLHFSEERGASALGSIVTHVMHIFRNAGAHHSGFVFANMLTSGALTNAKYVNNIVDASEEVSLEAATEALSYAFTVNSLFNIPLELHRSALRDPAVIGLWHFPNRKFTRTQHRVALTPLRGLNLGSLESRKVAVMALLSAFYVNEGSLLQKPHDGKLPYMTTFRNKTTNAQEKFAIFGTESSSEPLAERLLETASKCIARHPIAGISGCGDRFANLEELVLTLRDDGLFADIGMFPFVDFTDNGRHEGSQVIVNACVSDFMRVGAQTVRNEYRRSLLQSLNGLTQNESYLTLDRAEMIMNNLQMQKPEPTSHVIETLRTILPSESPSARLMLQVFEKMVSLRRQIDNQAYLDRREQQYAREREEAAARVQQGRRGQ